ncbi:MAG: glycosyltransferase family 2 protein [Lachnospiraceae bacterium]|nr:glycosyltransferase family 2 protein [Lachnospiraceae bacterium]
MFEKISIIIPVYNEAEKIEKTLIDVFNQTYNNIEVIIINDGSTDNTAEICKTIENDNFIYFEINNGGPANARNVGIEHASGKYICFLDADDEVEKNHIQLLYEHLRNNQVQLAVSRATCGHNDENIYVEEWENAAYRILKNDDYGGFLWNKLFCTEIIRENNLSLNTDFWMCEDLVFVLEYLRSCKIVAFINSCTYHYVEGHGISKFSLTPKRLTEFYAKKYIQDHLVSDKNEKVYNLVLDMCVSLSIRYYIKLIFCDHTFRQIKVDVAEEICAFYPVFKNHKKIPLKLKMLGAIIYFYEKGLNR